MEEHVRLAARRKHAKRQVECECGKTVHGNGGWASHRWACRAAQTEMHRLTPEPYQHLDRFRDQHRPERCDICTPPPPATKDGAPQ